MRPHRLHQAPVRTGVNQRYGRTGVQGALQHQWRDIHQSWIATLPTGGRHDCHIQRRGVGAARAGAHCGRPCADGEAYTVLRTRMIGSRVMWSVCRGSRRIVMPRRRLARCAYLRNSLLVLTVCTRLPLFVYRLRRYLLMWVFLDRNGLTSLLRRSLLSRSVRQNRQRLLRSQKQKRRSPCAPQLSVDAAAARRSCVW